MYARAWVSCLGISGKWEFEKVQLIMPHSLRPCLSQYFDSMSASLSTVSLLLPDPGDPQHSNQSYEAMPATKIESRESQTVFLPWVDRGQNALCSAQNFSWHVLSEADRFQQHLTLTLCPE